MHVYERWIVRRYLASALRLSRLAKPPRGDQDIVGWVESHARLLDLPAPPAKARSSRRRTSDEAPMHPASWKAWRTAANGMARTPVPSL
jgi:hypothetical protein